MSPVNSGSMVILSQGWEGLETANPAPLGAKLAESANLEVKVSRSPESEGLEKATKVPREVKLVGSASSGSMGSLSPESVNSNLVNLGNCT